MRVYADWGTLPAGDPPPGGGPKELTDMDSQEATLRLQAAEDRFARAWRRLTHLRDSELHDYDVEDLYRLALREYRTAEREVLKARYVAAVTRPELLTA